MNNAYRGRRFLTADYKAYKQELMYLLPKLKIPQGRLFLRLTVGYSSKGSDIDNCIKPFLDILQEKYEFNDNRVYLLEVAKEDVKKGEEFIDWDISGLD